MPSLDDIVRWLFRNPLSRVEVKADGSFKVVLVVMGEGRTLAEAFGVALEKVPGGRS